MNTEELGMLLLTLKHKDSGFYIVEAPDNPTLDDLAVKIKVAMGQAGKRTAVINFTEMKNQPEKSITQFVRDAVNAKPDVQIFFFQNLGASSKKRGVTGFLSNLNHAREGIYYLKRNFIFMMYPDFTEQFRKYAPDLLSWIPHKYSFESGYFTPGEFAQSVQLDQNIRFKGDKDRKYIKELIELYEMQLREAPDDLGYKIENIMKSLADLYKEYGDYSNEIPIREQIVKFYNLKNSYSYAISLVSLGIAYFNALTDDHAGNIEKAISYFEKALGIITREAMPFEWAAIKANLASAYYSRIRGNSADNIEKSIHFSEQALEIRTREAMPIEWAQTMNNLAIAYGNRIRGNSSDNIEKSIYFSEQALEIRTREVMPIEWAQTMNNLAIAYGNRIRGNSADNIEKAIRCYKQAMKVRTCEAMPIEWAQTMNNLATAYGKRIRGDRDENIEKTIICYQQALTVISQSTNPIEWGSIRKNLDEAYSEKQHSR